MNFLFDLDPEKVKKILRDIISREGAEETWKQYPQAELSARFPEFLGLLADLASMFQVLERTDVGMKCSFFTGMLVQQKLAELAVLEGQKEKVQ